MCSLPYWQSLVLDKPTTPSDEIFCNHPYCNNNNYSNNNNNSNNNYYNKIPWDLTETFLEARTAPSDQA